MMKTVICSALYDEISPLISRFHAQKIDQYKNRYPVFHCFHKAHEIYFIVTGMGEKNTGKSLSYSINKFGLDKKFNWILTGYAGAVAPDLVRGDLILPLEVRGFSRSYRVPGFTERPLNRKGLLFCVDRLYHPEDKKKLSGEYPETLAVDMESAAFCRVMQERSIGNFFICKVITDGSRFILPDVDLLKDPLIVCCFRSPLRTIRQMKNLLLIRRAMHRGSKRLADFFGEFHEDQ
ncbi:MAG: hypothetical protein PHF84_13080 [bacterium]|nr:hypothetical protein [bacterium]